MKMKDERFYNNQPKITAAPGKINLAKISSIINNLNDIMAPVVSNDLSGAKKSLDEKTLSLKKAILNLKEINDENIKLQKEKNRRLKQLKIIALLSSMHGNYVVADHIKTETISLLDGLNGFSIKRLDAQILKLNNILGVK